MMALGVQSIQGKGGIYMAREDVRIGKLKAERKRIAIALSQSALDVAYKERKLNMKLVDRLAEIEREIHK